MRLRFRYGYKTALVYLAVFAGMILLNFTMRSFEPFSLPLFAAAHLLIRAAAARALSCRVKRAYGASVELTVGEKSVEAAAFWDSGNTLTFRGTSPVVVLDGRVAEVLDGARVAGVMTVAGACGTRGAVAYYLDRLKVRDSDGERAYADVVAVSVDRDFDGFDVLLNCGLS